jgi:hypothetical protein
MDDYFLNPNSEVRGNRARARSVGFRGEKGIRFPVMILCHALMARHLRSRARAGARARVRWTAEPMVSICVNQTEDQETKLRTRDEFSRFSRARDVKLTSTKKFVLETSL